MLEFPSREVKINGTIAVASKRELANTCMADCCDTPVRRAIRMSFPQFGSLLTTPSLSQFFVLRSDSRMWEPLPCQCTIVFVRWRY
jgi:hypothetical protein